MKSSVKLGLGAFALTTVACGQLPGMPANPSVPSLSSSGSSNSSAAAQVERPLTADEATQQAQLEKQVQALLGAEARYSALQARGQKSPFCRPGDSFHKVVNAYQFKDRTLSCFTPMLSSSRYTTLADFQRDTDDVVKFDADEVKAGFAWQVENGEASGTKRVAAYEIGDVIVMAKIEPKSPDATKDLNFPQVTRKFGELTDEQHIVMDVFVRDLQTAKTMDLEAVKKRVYAKVTTEARAQVAKWNAEEEKELNASYLPKAGMSSPALVKIVTQYMKDAPGKTDIDPKNVKKVFVTSTGWDISKDKYNMILGKVADVTVAFARDDGRCAYVTYQVQRDYSGGGTYQPETAAYANGFASGWTKIKCDRIK